jgi:hypothetical protein
MRTRMRLAGLALSAALATALFPHSNALAEEQLAAPAAVVSPSLSAAAPRPWHDAGVSTTEVVVISGAATLTVIAVNALTGGLLTPVLTLGTGAGGGTTASAVIAIVAAHVIGASPEAALLAVGAPTAAASVGGPVNAALRDGYTSRQDLIDAFGESASRAKIMIDSGGRYLGSAASDWWNWATGP